MPVGAEIIDIPKAFAWAQPEITKPYVSGLGSVVAIILTIDVELMEMFATPIKEELKDVMELGKGGVTAHQKATPDKRTDAPHDDTELINVGYCVS